MNAQMLKEIIRISAEKIFYFTTVAVLITEMFLIDGSATGTVLSMPAYYVMIVSGVLHLTSPFWSQSAEPEAELVQ